MPDIKLTIFNAEVNSYAASANATVTYLADMEGSGVDDPSVMIQAMNLAPRIGSQEGFSSVPGAPNIGSASSGFSDFGTFTGHNLRVARVRPYVGNTNNSKKLFVDVYYESRPRPTIEVGSTAVQERTDTYLAQLQTQAGNFYLTRQQMTIDWLVKKGTYSIPGSTQQEPPTDVPLPKTTVQGTRFRLGSTIRISSTYYNDEMTLGQAIALAGLYTTTVNKNPLFYSLSNDASSWLTTAVGAVSMDGGYTMKAFGEFMFNPYGWDTHLVYTEPFTQQLAILTQTVVDNLWARSVVQNGNVPPPYIPDANGNDASTVPGFRGGGAGRFPQQTYYNLSPLVGFLSQGLLANVGQISQVLAPQ